MVTDVPWIRRVITFFGFTLPGEVRLFANREPEAAKSLLTG
ncbi:STAS/SEC14 domain-containing protein [Acidihalobacter ferrooxydans]|nr:STAS/SEC14 domain-containing protein [Acidihalobacter ferrooxydans]